MSTLSLNSALAHGNETVYTTIYLFFIKKICIKNLKYDKWYTKYYYHLWAHDSQVYFSVPNLSSKLLTQIANCLPIIPSKTKLTFLQPSLLQMFLLQLCKSEKSGINLEISPCPIPRVECFTPSSLHPVGFASKISLTSLSLPHPHPRWHCALPELLQ